MNKFEKKYNLQNRTDSIWTNMGIMINKRKTSYNKLKIN